MIFICRSGSDSLEKIFQWKFTDEKFPFYYRRKIIFLNNSKVTEKKNHESTYNNFNLSDFGRAKDDFEILIPVAGFTRS